MREWVSVVIELGTVLGEGTRDEGMGRGRTYCGSLSVSYASPMSLNRSTAASSSGFLSG